MGVTTSANLGGIQSWAVVVCSARPSYGAGDSYGDGDGYGDGPWSRTGKGWRP